ncbi:MAG TPA: multidrug ABC transporter ATP-binding protein [Firmicutes bacterium]|nr:multidrug ABC transporter ATP-binding protein [Bacillota bacterium]
MARNKFDMDEELEETFNFEQLKQMLKYVRPYKWKMILTLILMILANCAALVGPYLTKIALDDMIPNHNVNGLAILALIFIGSLVITGICMRLRIGAMSEIGQNILVAIRSDLFAHLQKLPFDYYDTRPHGKILVRVVNYVNTLSDLISNGFINLVSDILSLLIAVGFMLAIDIRLSLISFLGIPLMMGVILSLKNAQRKAYQRVSAKQSNLNAYVHESINGIKVTQSFAREEVNTDILKNVSTQYRQAWMESVKLNFLVWPAIDIISVGTVSCIYFAGIIYFSESIAVGVLVAFIGYVWRFWSPIVNIGNFYNQIITAMAYLERIFETLDEEPSISDVQNAFEMPLIRGKVNFNQVTFEYEPEKPILKSVSFEVNPGDTVALVGPTGAGKSTVVSLLSRFYNVNKGEVLIDDLDISKATLASLRKQMGVMLQDTFIFSGTIMDNIRYGKLDASDDEVIAAAKVVRAHDFISQLEEGYETEVNERGSRLSQGQRQLISFARALLADPKVLILDEATSSIDTQTEILLQEGLAQLLKGRTSFIIAHRLSTIKNADQIMYISDGEIAERGTHDELLSVGGYYKKLYDSQYIFLD